MAMDGRSKRSLRNASRRRSESLAAAARSRIWNSNFAPGIRTSLSADGKVLTMAEHYREPGMERVRDWVYEKQ
jgi:hypothetical protein